MNCKTCGAPLEEGAKACRNCGTTLVEMGLAPVPSKKAAVQKEESGKTDFEKRAEQFGGVQVKERKASSMSNVDPKVLSIVLLMTILVVFLVVKAIFDQKTMTLNLEGFEVTLPASMRSVDDDSFEIRTSMGVNSFSNNMMEFSCVRYSAANMIPGLLDKPDDNDFEQITAYYEAQNQLVTLDDDFAALLDEEFTQGLDGYKRIRLENGHLDFTYKDNSGVENYVEMRIVVKDLVIYQFSVLCSKTGKDKLSKQFNTIFNSIEMEQKSSSSD